MSSVDGLPEAVLWPRAGSALAQPGQASERQGLGGKFAERYGDDVKAIREDIYNVADETRTADQPSSAAS